MALRTYRSEEEYELLRGTSLDSIRASDSDPTRPYLHLRRRTFPPNTSIRRRIAPIAAVLGAGWCSTKKRRQHLQWYNLCCYAITTCAGFTVLLVLITALFWPSYTRLPHHYETLRKACMESTTPGRGNIHDENVFIAAALYDPEGTLVEGDWGNAVVALVDLLGPNNVYVSIYENDADSAAITALGKLKDRLDCQSHIPTLRSRK